MKDIFTDIVGNRKLRERLAKDILAGTLPHAFILEGPKGSGKHTVATQVAAALACTEKDRPDKPVPCMTCLACRKILEGKSPDLITVGCEGKSTIGVDTIRFLREDVRVVPNDSDQKSYIIEDADKMTPQAQNALLLTLEEPPAYAHFFLLCENAGLLLETIRSRAPVLRTEPIDIGEIDRYLCAHDRRAAQMKLADPVGYAELLTASGQGIGQALDYLEPKVFAPIRQTRALGRELICAAVHKEGARVVLPLLNRFSNKREVLREQLEAASEAVRDLILLKKTDDAPITFFSDRNDAIELSDCAPLPYLYGLGEAIRRALEELSRNANVRLCLIRMALAADMI